MVDTWFVCQHLCKIILSDRGRSRKGRNEIYNKNCNHQLVIKLCVINDICQAIACCFDYFYCVFNSQVALNIENCHIQD